MSKNIVKSPLSGDVDQIINTFWDLMFRPFWMGGFINIYQMNSAEPDLERRIVRDAGSYGRQLGRTIDMVKILEKHIDIEKLSKEDAVAMREFDELALAIDKVKRENAPFSPGNSVAAFLSDLEFMKKHDPENYKNTIDELKKYIDAD